MTEGKLEAKTRHLIITREFLEALAFDDLIDQRIAEAAKTALRQWDDPRKREDKP